ncbi:Sec8 exocyst complex component-specific domain-containing protein [Lipomyces arxii]|uniref:Sec8 exocyst complex component-specific domain-containing protein n=1 Tax=Lipomyces arxii TaxID=56418 RepID=UPI0034CE42FD
MSSNRSPLKSSLISRPSLSRSNSKATLAHSSSKSSHSTSSSQPLTSRSNSTNKILSPPLPPSRSASDLPPPLPPSRSLSRVSSIPNFSPSHDATIVPTVPAVPAVPQVALQMSSQAAIPQQARRTEANAAETYDSRQIDDILKYVERDWGSLLSEDCNPVITALELMDQSTIGRASEYNDFKDLSGKLEKIMQSIAMGHYQDINDSISTYKDIMATLDGSISRIRILRETLTQVKQNLAR